MGYARSALGTRQPQIWRIQFAGHSYLTKQHVKIGVFREFPLLPTKFVDESLECAALRGDNIPDLPVRKSPICSAHVRANPWVPTGWSPPRGDKYSAELRGTKADGRLYPLCLRPSRHRRI